MGIRMASRLAFGLLVCLTIRLAAQEPSSAASQVRKLEEKWTAAYKERQIDLLASLLAEEFVITVEDGSTYSKAGYITHSADPSVQVEVAELSYSFANGLSSDELCGVNNSAPPSVMCMSSSRRMPNSPRM
jgi:Domain of unknown function (DUF4440)